MFFLALLYTNDTFHVMKEPPALEACLPTRGVPRSSFQVCQREREREARRTPPGIPPTPPAPSVRYLRRSTTHEISPPPYTGQIEVKFWKFVFSFLFDSGWFSDPSKGGFGCFHTVLPISPIYMALLEMWTYNWNKVDSSHGVKERCI